MALGVTKSTDALTLLLTFSFLLSQLVSTRAVSNSRINILNSDFTLVEIFLQIEVGTPIARRPLAGPCVRNYRTELLGGRADRARRTGLIFSDLFHAGLGGRRNAGLGNVSTTRAAGISHVFQRSQYGLQVIERRWLWRFSHL